MRWRHEQAPLPIRDGPAVAGRSRASLLDLDWDCSMNSSSVAQNNARDAKSQLDAEWEAAAAEIAGKIEGPLTRILKSAADGLYQEVLEATQDYLADNAKFNIASRLDAADRERRAQWERAEAADRRAGELLVALKGLQSIMSSAESNASGNPEWEYVSARVKAARAAIAKAEDQL